MRRFYLHLGSQKMNDCFDGFEGFLSQNKVKMKIQDGDCKNVQTTHLRYHFHGFRWL